MSFEFLPKTKPI